VLEAVASGFGCGLVFASEAGTDPRLAPIEISEADVDVAEYVICQSRRADEHLIRAFLAASADVARERGWLRHPPEGASSSDPTANDALG
jgi:LysR family transcriptional regulator, low CO2-responsive transcriptional regulator